MTNEASKTNIQELETAGTVKSQPAQDPVTTTEKFLSSAWDDIEAEEERSKLEEENNLAMNRAIDWSDFYYLLPYIHAIVDYLTINQQRFPAKSMNELANSLEKLAKGFRALSDEEQARSRDKDVFIVVPNAATFNA